MQYRNIDNHGIAIRAEDRQAVEQVLKESGYENRDTTRMPHGLLLIYPVPAQNVAASKYEGLKALAPYIQTGERPSAIILEAKEPYQPATWVHLRFLNGEVQEVTTPAHQWEI